MASQEPEESGEPGGQYYFPAAGNGRELQRPRDLAAAGFAPDLIDSIEAHVRVHVDRRRPQRWALWQDGCLVHAQGDFNARHDVASLRKTWHAMGVGAAIAQGRLEGLDVPIARYLPELSGLHAEATWRHVLTQSAGFDYPYGDYPAMAPGEMWTYSDWNLVHLCNAMARLCGRRDFHDDYHAVAAGLYFDAIGLTDWSCVIKFDHLSGMEDGVRFELSLEHLGRLGLLVLARGRWGEQQIVPAWFVDQLEIRQTRGMHVNYSGPNDGVVRLDPAAFPEAPYGFLTWTNTGGDYYPGADRGWAWGSGTGGNVTMWNRRFGLVFAASGLAVTAGERGVPHLLERALRA